MAQSSFPLRFKNPRTKEMLRLVSSEIGVPMTEVAEEAIRHELVLLGADIERQLSDIVQALRSYQPERDIEHYLDLIEEGEARPDPIRARQLPATGTKAAGVSEATAIRVFSATPKKAAAQAEKRASALASFKQG